MRAPERRFAVAVDPGEVTDYTGVAFVEFYEHPQRSPFWRVPPPELRLRHVERLPLGTSHGARAAHVASLIDQVGRGECDLLVDGTGSGAAFVEAIRRLGFQPIEIGITSGHEVHYKRRRDDLGPREQVTVPNATFAASLLAALESPPMLRVADGLPFAPVLKQEMLVFRGKRFASGHESFGARGHGQHDDLTFATGYAVWWLRSGLQKPRAQSGSIRHPALR